MITAILVIWQIFSKVTELQEKARKEGILRSDEQEQKRTSEDNNLLVRKVQPFTKINKVD